MLFRKMLRDLNHNKMQFFSIFIMSMLAMYLYTGFASEVSGIETARKNYHELCNLADGWLQGNNFSESDLKNVSQINGIKNAERRFLIDGTGVNETYLNVYFQEENTINKPYVIEGEEYNPNNKQCIWLAYRYAKENHLKVGDDYSFKADDREFTLKIAGLVWSSEYEYYKEDSDIEPNYAHTGYAFCSSKLLDNISYNQIVFTSNVENVYSLDDSIDKILSYTSFADRDSQNGISALNDEIEQHKVMSEVFPVAFMLISLLSIITTMTRLIDKQRTEIGTMKALGVKKRKIVIHYLSYSFFPSLLGVMFGTILGPLTITPLLFNMKYQIDSSNEYLLPKVMPEYPISFWFIGIIIVIVCTLSTYFSCKKILKINPSETLRPVPPKTAKKCIFEKLPFWSKFTFSLQYNLRDLSRNKVRTVMGLIGTIGCMSLLVCGFACKENFSTIPDWYFGKINNYQTQIRFNDKISLDEAKKIKNEVDGGMWMEEKIEIKSANNDTKYTSNLDAVDGTNFFQITDANQNPLSYKDGDVAISRNLAKKLGISVGDTINWHLSDSDKWVKSKITIINCIPMGQAVVMTRNTIESLGYKFKPSGVMTNKILSEYNSEHVAYVYGHDKLRSAADSAIEMSNMIVIIMVVLACILAIVVLYNMGLISYTERKKELATLKVMGFKTGQLRSLLLRQNLWLSVVGAIIGTPIGVWLLQILLDSQGDSFDITAKCSIGSFLISFAITCGVSAVVSLFFSGKVKGLDMVETLKGME